MARGRWGIEQGTLFCVIARTPTARVLGCACGAAKQRPADATESVPAGEHAMSGFLVGHSFLRVG